MIHTVFNSELEFRESIIVHSNIIDKIYIFEDQLDKYIFFYCIFKNNIIYSSKEKANNNCLYYLNIYKSIQKDLKLDIIFESKKEKTLKLKKI